MLNTLFFFRIFWTVDCFLNGTNELFLEISALTLDEASRLGRGRDGKQRKKTILNLKNKIKFLKFLANVIVTVF